MKNIIVKPFEQFLNTLSDDTLDDLISVKLCISVDDNNYKLASEGVNIKPYLSTDSTSIKEILLANQDAILHNIPFMPK